MKFCVVGPAHPFRGGIAHHTTLLCQHLSERHEVEAVTFKRLYPAMLFPGKSQTDPSKSTPSFPASAKIDSMNPFTWSAAGDYIKSLEADWVLIQWWQPFFGPCLASVASKAGSRVAFICHNVLPHESMPLTRMLTHRALKHGNGFIVHSEQDRDDLMGLLPGLSPEVVVKTVHPEYELFPMTGMTKSEARSQLGIDGKVILFFGLVRKYKGLMDLINALALVRDKDLTCLVVGEFYDKGTEYTSRIKELGLGERIRIINRYVPNEEVEPYFVATDAVVLPYRSATQSGIAQMAFRFGRPVIATSVGGLPESIDNNRTGLLVPPRDPTALAHAIDRYFDESLESGFSTAIRANADRFSWDRVIEAIESLTQK